MKVYIDNLTFKTIIGILPFERKQKQNVIVNVSFEYDFVSDSFVDYSKVAKDIKKDMKKNKYKLIEEAIVSLKDKLTTSYPIKNLYIKISKPDILKDCSVSVSN